MPIINLKISASYDAQLSQHLVEEVTNATVTILKKKPDVTAITIQFIDTKHWFIANKSLEELKQKSFYLDIKITDGTNLKDEKMLYVKTIFDIMNKYLSPLHNESYVYVEEVKADAYGFGGKTQEFRFIDKLK